MKAISHINSHTSFSILSYASPNLSTVMSVAFNIDVFHTGAVRSLPIKWCAVKI
jgi:hypothetical protein